ncbi:hexose kinase [Carnobacteriaceae bacterium zg-ZUI252]|nr:hexose kinase [Carnobacteriaceae bacterium zg-ZUI252]MBS4770337.1 hexose kinase [Carnobacteriaceae bacterium zg-ZUI240]
MIITVTLNPAIDMAYELDTLQLDSTNRIKKVEKTAGGKGLNVSRVLHQIGDDIMALGFAGGHTGKTIVEKLTDLGIQNDFTTIDGETRNCISVMHDGQQTELLEKGPTISQSEQNEFINTFIKHAQHADVIVLSGSLSDGLPTNFYAQLLERVSQHKVVVDTSNQALLECLKGAVKPFAIKPNLDELSHLFNRKVEITELPTLLVENEWLKEIPLVCVSLGGDGAMVKYNHNVYRVRIPKITVVSPTGSGDSVVAGLASGLQRGYAIEEWLQHAMVLGMLNAQQSKTGYVNLDNYNDLKEKITVEKIG